jgi:hypothetical protein
MLTTAKCCAKKQNDCSESVETPSDKRRAKLQTSGTIFNKQTQLLAYANDIDIVGKSLEAVRDAYLALEAEAAKVVLKINEQKTKYMIASGNRTILDSKPTVAFGDKNFEVVNEFVYLGALVTTKMTWV